MLPAPQKASFLRLAFCFIKILIRIFQAFEYKYQLVPYLSIVQVISPVGLVHTNDGDICFPSGMDNMGPVISKLRETLTGIQMGEIEAPEGWIHIIC